MIPIPGRVFRFPALNIFVQVIKKTADYEVHLVRDGFMIKILVPSDVQSCKMAPLNAFWDQERVGHLTKVQLTNMIKKLTEADDHAHLKRRRVLRQCRGLRTISREALAADPTGRPGWRSRQRRRQHNLL